MQSETMHTLRYSHTRTHTHTHTHTHTAALNIHKQQLHYAELLADFAVGRLTLVLHVLWI